MGLRRLGPGGRPASVPEAGLFVFLLFVLGSALQGCGRDSEERPDPEVEAARQMGLGAGARVHRVTLGGRGGEEHAVPRVVEASVGDAVEFLTVDHRVHRVVFPVDSLADGPRGFLERTGQTESPPMAFRGSRFVLLLEGASPGRYPYVSEGHGGTMGGTIRVSVSPDTLSPFH